MGSSDWHVKGPRNRGMSCCGTPGGSSAGTQSPCTELHRSRELATQRDLDHQQFRCSESVEQNTVNYRPTARAIAIVRVKPSASISLTAMLALSSLKITSIGFDICHRRPPLLAFCDLDQLFPCQTFRMLRYRSMVRADAKIHATTFTDVDSSIEWCH